MTSSAAISLFFVLQATRHQLQDFVFAWRQRLDRLTVLTLADVMEQLGHDNRLQERPARVDDANRLEEFFARRTFEQIALRPGLHRAENSLVGSKAVKTITRTGMPFARMVLSAPTPSISGISRSSSRTSGRS